MNLLDLITVLALTQFLFFGTRVGRARSLYGVKAPAVTGHEMFERAYRVQMNTLELLVILLPALYLSARYWSPLWSALAGAVYIVGRFVYWRAYTANPASRGLGFLLSVGPIFTVMVMTLVGAIRAMI